MKTPPKAKADPALQLAALAEEIYESLAQHFPVCLASDEFHYFPHYTSQHLDWAYWDDFSVDAVITIANQIQQWEQQLNALRPVQPSSSLCVDIDMLSQVLTTLREQLREVRFHETQPTFYLSIASIGLAQAWDHSSQAFDQRMAALPAFIDSAIANLHQIPELFRDLGLDMVPKIKTWLSALSIEDTALLAAAMSALERLQAHMEQAVTVPDFHLSAKMYARIVSRHMGCQMTLEEIIWHLEQEIEETQTILEQEAARIEPGQTWQEVLGAVQAPAAGEAGLQGLYQTIIAQLKAHCISQGFVSEAMASNCQVQVEIIPDHLMPIRSDAAYSIPAGHPPQGGTFYIMPGRQGQPAPADIILLTAHETYPGHHLLDTFRWGLEQPLRRPLEFPLFYEGWASFAEEILFDSGYFSGPVDRLLMAKRRLWRAVRGRADVDLHSGTVSMQGAAAALAAYGIAPERATAMAQRYALKPGYQLSYTMGRRKFRQLYTNFLAKGCTLDRFVRQVLAQGEVGFDHLAEMLFYIGRQK